MDGVVDSFETLGGTLQPLLKAADAPSTAPCFLCQPIKDFAAAAASTPSCCSTPTIVATLRACSTSEAFWVTSAGARDCAAGMVFMLSLASFARDTAKARVWRKSPSVAPRRRSPVNAFGYVCSVVLSFMNA